MAGTGLTKRLVGGAEVELQPKIPVLVAGAGVAEPKSDVECAGATPTLLLVEGTPPNTLNPLRLDAALELEPKVGGGGEVMEVLPGGKTCVVFVPHVTMITNINDN